MNNGLIEQIGAPHDSTIARRRASLPASSAPPPWTSALHGCSRLRAGPTRAHFDEIALSVPAATRARTSMQLLGRKQLSSAYAGAHDRNARPTATGEPSHLSVVAGLVPSDGHGDDGVLLGQGTSFGARGAPTHAGNAGGREHDAAGDMDNMHLIDEAMRAGDLGHGLINARVDILIFLTRDRRP